MPTRREALKACALPFALPLALPFAPRLEAAGVGADLARLADADSLRLLRGRAATRALFLWGDALARTGCRARVVAYVSPPAPPAGDPVASARVTRDRSGRVFVYSHSPAFRRPWRRGVEFDSDELVGFAVADLARRVEARVRYDDALALADGRTPPYATVDWPGVVVPAAAAPGDAGPGYRLEAVVRYHA